MDDAEPDDPSLVVGKKAMAVAAKALGDETLFASLHQLALKVDHEMRS